MWSGLAGRSPGFRIVLLPAPSREAWRFPVGLLRVSSPVTVAGQRRILTVFPGGSFAALHRKPYLFDCGPDLSTWQGVRQADLRAGLRLQEVGAALLGASRHGGTGVARGGPEVANGVGWESPPTDRATTRRIACARV